LTFFILNLVFGISLVNDTRRSKGDPSISKSITHNYGNVFSDKQMRPSIPSTSTTRPMNTFQNSSTNILLNWEAGKDGPEWAELTGYVSNTSNLIVSVKFFFQNDCSCERWYAVDNADNHEVIHVQQHFVNEG